MIPSINHQPCPRRSRSEPKCCFRSVRLLSIALVCLLPTTGLLAQEYSSRVEHLASLADLPPASSIGIGGNVSFATEAEPPQSSPPNRYQKPSDWWVAVYPVFAWAPIFGVSTREFPSTPGGGGGTGSLLPPGHASGSLNGAAFAWFRLEKSKWSADATGLWAGLSGERSNPFVHVGAHVVFGQIMGGRELLPDLFLEGGVRRLALSVNLRIEDFPEVDWKPGVWDPLVGLTYRRQLSKKWRIYAHADGGGFGVGADSDVAGTVRAEWQFVHHFGLTMGYGALHFRITDTVAQRSLEIKQTLNGPIFGFGIYF